MKKIITFAILSMLHLIAIGVIIAAFVPMAKWYFDAKPLWGVDFYYTVTLVKAISNHVKLPWMQWLSIWFCGWPYLSNFPLLHYYLLLPLQHFMDIIPAVKLWMLISSVLFFTGNYAVFYRLSKNHGLALVLSVCGVYSVGFYGGLMWGGSLPAFATQAFMPWVIWCIIAYLQGRSRKFIYLGAILTGLAIWAHPQIVIAYIYPTVAILLLFSVFTQPVKARIVSFLLFGILSMAIGWPVLNDTFGSAIKLFFVRDTLSQTAASTVKLPETANGINEIIRFQQLQPWRIIDDTNLAVFYFLGGSAALFLLCLIFPNRIKRLIAIFPFLLVTAYFIGFTVMFAYGIAFFQGGWYRLFWAVTLWVGMLASIFWGKAVEGLDLLLKKQRLVRSILLIIANVAAVAVGVIYIPKFSDNIKEKIIARSTISSAFPAIVNMISSTQDLEKIKPQIIPEWLDATDTNHRLYSADQTLNIWWNSIFEIPLARGYLDPPLVSQTRGYLFLLDTSLSQDGESGADQLVTAFHYPEQVSLNNTAFMVNWYGIKYINTLNGGSSSAFNQLPKNFNTDTYVAKQQTITVDNSSIQGAPQTLTFYELKPENVLPIVSATNSPTLGIIAGDYAYELILRALADTGIGPQKVIPVKLNQTIDRIKEVDLEGMDSLMVYNYKYFNKDKAFDLLKKYVANGHKLFIDTGIETAESDSAGLPDLFPFSQSKRASLGEYWQWEIGDHPLNQGIDFNLFDPPLFDNTPWKFSYPENNFSGLQILANNGKTLMISKNLGKGEVVWSGINLPYHVNHSHNEEEVKFWKNLITYLVPKSPEGEISQNVEFVSAEKRKISVMGARGILFTEQAYPGWRINHNLRIYPAGPAYPGFMYVPIPVNLRSSRNDYIFSYSGSLKSWLYSGLAIIIVVFLLDNIFLNSWLIGRHIKKIISWSRRRIKTWWAKEDID